MKIAITVDPEIPVPPLLYGGIERIVDMLVKGLVQRGHEVVLYAHQESKVPCKLVPYKGTSPVSKKDTLLNTWQVSGIRRGNFDLVHSFGRIAYLTALLPTALPKIMSYQREPTISRVQWAMRLSKKDTMYFTGCSGYIANQIKPYAPAFAIPNGVPLDIYDFQETVADDAPLVFLGRIEHIKGTHLAVEVAQKSNRRLIIAGNIPEDPTHQAYFKEKVEPFVDGEQIQYVGPVNDVQKNKLMGEAYAFLMPILWNEPFGIVMAEALACGTPVIGLERGSVPEVVQDGVNGFKCQDVAEMVAAVAKIPEIRRSNCREIAEQRFSDRAIVDAYEALYQQVIKQV